MASSLPSDLYPSYILNDVIVRKPSQTSPFLDMLISSLVLRTIITQCYLSALSVRYPAVRQQARLSVWFTDLLLAMKHS